MPLSQPVPADESVRIWNHTFTFEPAMLAALVNALATVVALLAGVTDTQQAAIATIGMAVATIITTVAVRPLKLPAITGAIATAFVAVAAFGLHVSPEIIALVNMAVTTLAGILVRGQVTPLAKLRRAAPLTGSRHDSAWLADVHRPGPNGRMFAELPEEHALAAAASGQFIMEDDVTASLFTPGCGAYAGYSRASSFANMTAVRAYAASQGAKSFCYTPTARDVTGADALDIEPGDAVPADAPGAYAKGIRYFYGSASWISSIVSHLSAAGIPRSAYKIISAHYIGAHICGPGSCGYPQADATQFTSTYKGRSLDATLCPAGFLSGGTPSPAPAPSLPTLRQGSTDAKNVTLLRIKLDYFGAGLAAGADGSDHAFGPWVDAAVRAFQLVNFGPTGMDGVVGPATWAALNNLKSRHIPMHVPDPSAPAPVPAPAPTPAPVPPPAPGVPTGLSATTYLTGNFSWGAVAGAPEYDFQVSEGTPDAPGHERVRETVAGTHVAGALIGLAGRPYFWRVGVKGGKWSPGKKLPS
jgi:peptidoglycan hydrolase-like protein with peptidoglycan-binding domain